MRGMTGVEVVVLMAVVVVCAVLLFFFAARWGLQGTGAASAVERAAAGNVLATAINALSTVDGGEVRIAFQQELRIAVVDNDIEVGDEKAVVDNVLVAPVKGNVVIEKARTVCGRKRAGEPVEVAAC